MPRGLLVFLVLHILTLHSKSSKTTYEENQEPIPTSFQEPAANTTQLNPTEVNANISNSLLELANQYVTAKFTLKLLFNNDPTYLSRSLCPNDTSIYCEDPIKYPSDIVHRLLDEERLKQFFIGKEMTDSMELIEEDYEGVDMEDEGEDKPTMWPVASALLADYESSGKGSKAGWTKISIFGNRVPTTTPAIPISNINKPEQLPLSHPVKQRPPFRQRPTRPHHMRPQRPRPEEPHQTGHHPKLTHTRPQRPPTTQPQAIPIRPQPHKPHHEEPQVPEGPQQTRPQEVLLEEVPLCRTVSSYVFPKRAINKDHKFRFIINVPEKDYVQAVRVEKCHSAGSECSLHGDLTFSDLGIRTICRQKYSYQRLLALNEDERDVVDLFKFPSSCVCHQVMETPFVGGHEYGMMPSN